MKPMVRRTLLALPLALLVLLAGVLYLLHQPRFVLGQLDRHLTANLGWRLEATDGFSLKWGRTTVLEARGVRLTNPQWPQATGQMLFSAGHLRLEFRPLELLHGQLDLRQLSLADCELRLHRNAEGGSNWSSPGQAASDGMDAETGDSGWNLAQLDIDSCAVSSHTAGRADELLVQLDRAAMAVDEQQSLEFSASGAIDQQQLAIRGSLRPLEALWRGGKVQHSLDLQAGDNVLHSEGIIEDLHSGDGADLNFRFSGPEFATITEWLALPEFSRGEFDASVFMRRAEKNGTIEIGIAADLGNLEIQGGGQLDRLISPTLGHVSVQAKGPDLAVLAKTFGVPGLPPGAFEVDLRALVESGVTQLENLVVRTGSGRVRASGHLGAWPTLQDSAIALELHTADLPAWLQSLTQELHHLGGLEGTLSLAGDPQSGMELTGQGQLGLRGSEQHREFSLAGAVRPGSGKVRLEQIDFRLGEDRLELSGEWAHGGDFSGSSARLGLHVANLAASGPWLKLPATGLPARPLQLQAELSLPGRGLEFHVSADKANGQKIHLDGDIPDLGQMLGINARFDIELPSLRLAQWLLPAMPLPDLPFAAQGELINDERLGKTRFNGALLRIRDTRLEVNGDLFQQQGLEGSSAHWSLRSPDWREICGEACAAIPAVPGLDGITSRGQWRRNGGADLFDTVSIETGLADIRLDGQVEAARPVPGAASSNRPAQFALGIRGKDASRLNPLVGPLFDDQSFELKTRVSLEPGRIVGQDIDFRQGKTVLAGRVEVELAQRPVITAHVSAPVLDLTSWQEYVVENQAGRAAGPDPNKGKKQRGLLFPDEAIRLVGKTPVDLSLDVDIGQLLMGTNLIRQLQARAEWRADNLQVSNFEFRGDQGGHYAGHLSAQQQDGVTELALFTLADDLKLGLIGRSGQDPATLPPSDILIDLTGKGRTWHELAQSLNGRARWYAGAGRVSATGLDFLFGDLLTQVLTTLNPLAKSSQYTALSCGVYAADFSAGLVTMAPIVIQTDSITAFSNGQVNLADESINLNFNAVPRKGLGISAASVVNPFFRIGGTLVKPAVELDVTKGAISGSVMVATAGLSVLFKSLSDRLLASKNPCGDARAEIERVDRSRQEPPASP